MSTALQRQRQREADDIGQIIARMRQQRPPGRHNAFPAPSPTSDQLATASRHSEQIIAAKNPQTGEVIARTDRIVSLIDVMHKDKQVPMDLWHAGSRYRDMFLSYLGSSKGVSSYGDYIAAGPASQRLGITETQVKAGHGLRLATVAAFGTFTDEKNGKKWVVDEQLMTLVIPALISEKREVTQGNIGRQRSLYTGSAQVPAAGAQAVVEVLHRLALHFGYRER